VEVVYIMNKNGPEDTDYFPFHRTFRYDNESDKAEQEGKPWEKPDLYKIAYYFFILKKESI